jgi:hypothetical protein
MADKSLAVNIFFSTFFIIYKIGLDYDQGQKWWQGVARLGMEP